MEPYLWKTRPDGINVINIGKTWYVFFWESWDVSRTELDNQELGNRGLGNQKLGTFYAYSEGVMTLGT